MNLNISIGDLVYLLPSIEKKYFYWPNIKAGDIGEVTAITESTEYSVDHVELKIKDGHYIGALVTDIQLCHST